LKAKLSQFAKQPCATELGPSGEPLAQLCLEGLEQRLAVRPR
jgi:hypothetical protein